jgi:hypothetical protein
MVSLYTVWYNFVRINKAVKIAPAAAAGVSKTLWTMDSIEGLIDAAAVAPTKRGSETVDYYQGQVVEYLRSDRAIFVNTECCIQLYEAANPKAREHWYCDAVACDFRNRTAFLCEVSYSKQLSSLIKRLRGWHQHWDLVCGALRRDCCIPTDWTARPWLFVPDYLVDTLVKGLTQITGDLATLRFQPKVTTLEATQPWKVERSWDRRGELEKPTVPEPLRT